MLKIRLQRVGRKHDPSFRIVLTDSKNGPKSGKFLEILGNYDPKKDIRKVDGDRVKELMAQGAQVSDTVHNILVSEKVIDGKKVNVLPKKSPVVSEEEKKAEEEATAKTEETPVEETSTTEETPATEETTTEETATTEEVIEETPAEETKEEAPTEDAKEEEEVKEEK